MIDFIVEIIVKNIIERPLLVRALRLAIDIDRVNNVHTTITVESDPVEEQLN